METSLKVYHQELSDKNTFWIQNLLPTFDMNSLRTPEKKRHCRSKPKLVAFF